MSGSLLGILSKGRTHVKSQLNSRTQMDAIRLWVKTHELEIRSAKERGYTWREITRACIELWGFNKEFKGVYMRKSEDLLRVCYYDVQRGSKSSHISKKSEGMNLRVPGRTIMLSED